MALTETPITQRDAVLDRAKSILPVLAAHAADVDAENRFPLEAMRALRVSGLLGLVVPCAYGGLGASWETMAAVAQLFGGECLSTALLWAMHCQQVALITDSGSASPDLREDILARVASGDLLLASVTSEEKKGGHLLTALAPLIFDGDEMILRRVAPSVSGGSEADGFLITMRADEASPPTEVALVYADRSELDATVTSAWSAMGMRGTDTVGMTFDGRLTRDSIIAMSEGFRRLAVTTMIPVGHIAWSACWLGAGTRALREVVGLLRDPRERDGGKPQNDLVAWRLANIRLRIESVRAFLECFLRDYTAARAECAPLDFYEAPSFNVQVNNLKLIASEQLFRAVDDLVQLAGLRFGYVRDARVALERRFRDLRSAALMYSNDRLYVANGKLTLVDPEFAPGS